MRQPMTFPINEADIKFSEFAHNDTPHYFRRIINRLIYQDIVQTAGGLKPLWLTRIALEVLKSIHTPSNKL